MQKLWRGAGGTSPVLYTAGWLEKNAAPAILSSVPVFTFPMPASHLRAPPSAAAVVPRQNLPRCGPQFAWCRNLENGLQSKRSWSPLLRQARGPSSAAWLHGETGRGLRAAEGLRDRAGEKGRSGKEAEGVVVEGERKSQEPQQHQQQSGVVNNGVVERRQRGGGSNGTPVLCPELLMIPGVGPRNLRKLVDKGFNGVAQLKQLYRDKDDAEI